MIPKILLEYTWTKNYVGTIIELSFRFYYRSIGDKFRYDCHKNIDICGDNYLDHKKLKI